MTNVCFKMGSNYRMYHTFVYYVFSKPDQYKQVLKCPKKVVNDPFKKQS